MYYESTTLFTVDQEYSPDNGKFIYFNEDSLKFDPFGYYSYKDIYYNKREFGEPFFEDYPIQNFDFKMKDSYLVLD
jgi:hypothetical protein